MHPTPFVEPLPPSLTPERAFRNLSRGRGLFYLDSAAPAGGLGRWSIVGFDPYTVLDARELSAAGRDPWNELAATVRRGQRGRLDVPGPFNGGAIGFLSYDLGRRFERLPRHARDDLQVPDFWFGFYDLFAVFDHQSGQGWIVATGDSTQGEEHTRHTRERASTMRELLLRDPQPEDRFRCGIPQSRHTRESYRMTVMQCQEWIAAGHIYQVNLSHRFTAPFEGRAEALYLRLRRTNPAPFAMYLDTGEQQILSTSPERFVRIGDGKIETRPIKGTRPRGSDPESDRRFAAELLASSKDRAELTMIVDLLRNDLGKVCSFGSVRTESLAHLESYETVHHLVGVVRGHLRPGLDVCHAIPACFPGGSITGAPKIRAMEILEDLEPVRRGVSYGSLGYLGFDGRADLNIAIRTVLVKNNHLYVHVGGGIVADSDPDAEYEETLHKAEGIFRALRPDDTVAAGPHQATVQERWE